MRPIDADAVYRLFEPFGEVLGQWSDAYSQTLKMINDIPVSEDVELVVHGEWVPHPTEEEWDVCTACGTGCKRREIGYDTYFERTYVTEYGYPFCPNCGAKMNKESE